MLFKALFIICLLPSRGYGRVSLPAGIDTEIEGKQVRCFDLEAMKILHKLMIDLTFLNSKVELTEELVKDHKTSMSFLEAQLLACKNISDFLKQDRIRLKKKWTNENRLRHIAENRVPASTWLAWAAAGTATVVATILSIVILKD